MLETTVDDLGKVDAKYQDLYVKTDNGYELEVDLTGLKSALSKERQNARDAQKMLKQFEGVDVNRYNELTGLEEESLLKNESYLRAKKRWEKERDALKSDIVTKDQKVREILVDNEVRKTALEAGIDPESIDDVIQLTSNNFQLDDNGKIAVVDKEGNKISDGVKDFFNETYKELKPRFYKASSGSGGGSLPNLGPVAPNSATEAYNQAIKNGNFQAAIAIKNKQFIKS